MTIKAIESTAPKYYSYMRDTYLDRMETTVSKVGDENGTKYLVLTDTIFHPQGGGQRSDLGTINNISVMKAEKHGTPTHFEVRHLVGDTAELKEGDAVQVCIDIANRIFNARLHSSGHLIASLVEEMRPGLKAVQGHHFPGESRVEFAKDKDLKEEDIKLDTFASDLSNALYTAIQNSLPLNMKMDEESRAVAFGDYPPVPCGGTHLSNTQEIEGVTIKSVQTKKGKIRVSYSVAGEE